FVDDPKAVKFTVGGSDWTCDLTSYACSKSDTKPATEPVPPRPEGALDDDEPEGFQPPWFDGTAQDDPDPAPQRRQGQGRGAAQGQRPEFGGYFGNSRSPDDKWTAFIKDANVYLRGGDGPEVQLSTDGKEGNAYGMLQWSPDSATLAAFRIEPSDRKEVQLIESSPAGRCRPNPTARP